MAPREPLELRERGERTAVGVDLGQRQAAATQEDAPMHDRACQTPTYSAWDLASRNLIDGFKSRAELDAWLRSLDQVDGIGILEAVGERRVRWLEPDELLSYTDTSGVARSLPAPRMSSRSAG